MGDLTSTTWPFIKNGIVACQGRLSISWQDPRGMLMISGEKACVCALHGRHCLPDTLLMNNERQSHGKIIANGASWDASTGQVRFMDFL